MADQVNLYLDRARMAARIGVIGRVTEVRPRRANRSFARWSASIATSSLAFAHGLPGRDARFQGERQDLEEMLGNLLDNASKWARSKVMLSAAPPCRPTRPTAPATGSKFASTTTGRA